MDKPKAVRKGKTQSPSVSDKTTASPEVVITAPTENPPPAPAKPEVLAPVVTKPKSKPKPKTATDLNQADFPLHPERIWPD